MISITAAQAGTIIVDIIPIGRVGAMLLATAEAVMAQLELSPVVQEVPCSGTLWGRNRRNDCWWRRWCVGRKDSR
jgi:hypothetical protein